MPSKLKKMFQDLIIYSALLSDCEKPDFKNDALAGVRANFFNAKGSPQTERTELVLDGRDCALYCTMKRGEPLSWKITRGGAPYQTVKRSFDGSYCVITYGDNGIVTKRQFFGIDHLWRRTEYYDNRLENKITAVLSPKKPEKPDVLICEKFTENGKVRTELFPSPTSTKKRCAGLIYSNCGMIWYDESFRPADAPTDEAQDENGGFRFAPESFSTAANADLLDLKNAPYLTAEDIPAPDSTPQTTEEPSETEYSAYDKIESILFEAHKTNKNIFGELASHAADEEIHEQKNETETTPQPDAVTDTEAETEPETVTEAEPETETETEPEAVTEAEPETETETEPEAVTEAEPETETEAEPEAAQEPEREHEPVETEVCEEGEPDTVIPTKNGVYAYYGEVDDEGRRQGRGRTATPDGLTSYDGEYLDDKRDGFGVCYYRQGSPNYAGDWIDGNREGRGVGYRLSDGTMHAGKWSKNTPEGFGARFDREGNFLDVCTYVGGVRNGKSVSFDEDGNVVVKMWKDGEQVSEKIISD